MKRIRMQLGLTQEKFAELVGVAPNSIARQERRELGIKESLARLIRIIAEQHESATNSKESRRAARGKRKDPKTARHPGRTDRKPAAVPARGRRRAH